MVSNFKKITLTVVVALLVQLSVHAQNSQPKIIALVNKATWCHICQSNGPRVEKELMPMLMQDGDIQVVVNDLSNKETKAKSKPQLKEAGLTSFAKDHTGTGMIYFIDADTKELLTSISLAESNDNIITAYHEAGSKLDMPKHGEKGHSCDENCKAKMQKP